MAKPRADVVICGAGIAGVSAAYHLVVRHGIDGVVLVDERPPLTLTSDKSTECFRNWWPGPGDDMVRLMNRSIDLLQELAAFRDNPFALNHNGYAHFTARPQQAAAYEESARRISRLGAGPLRIHRGGAADDELPPLLYDDPSPGPDGADLVLDRDWILRHYPFLNPEVVAMLRPRRCGWLSAQQLGMVLLEEAESHGLRRIRGRVTEVEVRDGAVAGVGVVRGSHKESWVTGRFVNAAGPLLAEVGRMLGMGEATAPPIPVFNELHGKVTFTDHLGILPRQLPLMIWSDPVTLPWTDEERTLLEQDREMQWLRREMPAGVHFRPEGSSGSQAVVVLWTYELERREPVFPPVFADLYPQVVLRGLTRMVPALAAYFDKARAPYVDGGYYCKTRENRPLIGPLPVSGAYVLGALSGFGIMASQGAADLLAAHITGSGLPSYASAFTLDRYDDPQYRRRLEGWEATTGQL